MRVCLRYSTATILRAGNTIKPPVPSSPVHHQRKKKTKQVFFYLRSLVSRPLAARGAKCGAPHWAYCFISPICEYLCWTNPSIKTTEPLLLCLTSHHTAAAHQTPRSTESNWPPGSVYCVLQHSTAAPWKVEISRLTLLFYFDKVGHVHCKDMCVLTSHLVCFLVLKYSQK